ncbi:hypothetical protein RFI_11853, partial [Reticulomyxa filosa]
MPILTNYRLIFHPCDKQFLTHRIRSYFEIPLTTIVKDGISVALLESTDSGQMPIRRLQQHYKAQMEKKKEGKSDRSNEHVRSNESRVGGLGSSYAQQLHDYNNTNDNHGNGNDNDNGNGNGNENDNDNDNIVSTYPSQRITSDQRQSVMTVRRVPQDNCSAKDNADSIRQALLHRNYQYLFQISCKDVRKMDWIFDISASRMSEWKQWLCNQLKRISVVDTFAFKQQRQPSQQHGQVRTQQKAKTKAYEATVYDEGWELYTPFEEFTRQGVPFVDNQPISASSSIASASVSTGNETKQANNKEKMDWVYSSNSYPIKELSSSNVKNENVNKDKYNSNNSN